MDRISDPPLAVVVSGDASIVDSADTVAVPAFSCRLDGFVNDTFSEVRQSVGVPADVGLPRRPGQYPAGHRPGQGQLLFGFSMYATAGGSEVIDLWIGHRRVADSPRNHGRERTLSPRAPAVPAEATLSVPYRLPHLRSPGLDRAPAGRSEGADYLDLLPPHDRLRDSSQQLQAEFRSCFPGLAPHRRPLGPPPDPALSPSSTDARGRAPLPAAGRRPQAYPSTRVNSNQATAFAC